MNPTLAKVLLWLLVINLDISRGPQRHHPERGDEIRVENKCLIGVAQAADGGYDSSGLHVVFVERRGEKLAMYQPVAYFIPEHIPDPSIRPNDEELWVEVTIPKKGPPRPIRLGVKKGEAPIAPLEIR